MKKNKNFINFYSTVSSEKQYLFLLVLVMLSALQLVCVKQNTREALSRLHRYNDRRENLFNEQTKLLLESSTFSNFSRIEKTAKIHYKMTSPHVKQMVVVHE